VKSLWFDPQHHRKKEKKEEGEEGGEERKEGKKTNRKEREGGRNETKRRNKTQHIDYFIDLREASFLIIFHFIVGCFDPIYL
jgi:hypothetical protein